MLNKIYDKLKKFIKEYYKNIIFFTILYVFFMWPINYFIITGGGIMKVGNRIEIENQYDSKGSFNLAYVSEAKGTIATYLLSYIIPDWKRIKVSDYTYDNEETIEDVNFRGNIDLLNANCYAIKNAYQKANKTYIVTDTDLYIYFIDNKKTNNFKVGDKVLKVDGQKINSVEDYKNIISNHKENDTLEVLVERNKKEKKVKATIYRDKDKLLTGVYITSIDSYKTYPKINIKFKKSESGPSGGLIETLDIYNKLTKKDITKGRKIAGTGEIDSQGNVLPIGEVKYKLLGAVKNKADIFLVPNKKNYKTCIKLKKDRKLKIKIIGVSTFEEAVRELNK